MSISIFAKRAFLNTNPYNDFVSKEVSYKGNGHLQRVSSMIRGDQIAEKIEAKFNPESGYENDTCIYVKPYVKADQDFKFGGKKAYLDIIDGHVLGELAKKHPEVGVIVCSEADQKIMSEAITNEIVLIPQHHCNFDRIRRNRTGIKTVGVIGEAKAFAFLPKELRSELNSRGIELLEYSKFFSRQDIIDFYKSIDLQIVWRPYKKILSNPLKIVNASSFGIPTIALDEPAFKEVERCYIPVDTLKEFLSYLDELVTSPQIYTECAEMCIEDSERYHIDTIASLYKQL